MIHGCCPGRSIGKVCYFALIGFLALLLAGPVLGLLSVLFSIIVAIFSAALVAFVVILPFAILGFVIVAPIKALSTGRPVQWSRLGNLCQKLWRGILGAAWWCSRKLVLIATPRLFVKTIRHERGDAQRSLAGRSRPAVIFQTD